MKSEKTGNDLVTENDLSTPEKNLMNLISGKTPKTDHDKKMVADIEAIEKAGRIVEIPAM